jgi:hypothetical protein
MPNQKHHAWQVRIQQEGKDFRVYYQYRYPKGPVENCDPRRFNSLEEAEQFAKYVRRANRIYTELCGENTEEVA